MRAGKRFQSLENPRCTSGDAIFRISCKARDQNAGSFVKKLHENACRVRLFPKYSGKIGFLE
jgi:hypothetical protein